MSSSSLWYYVCIYLVSARTTYVKQRTAGRLNSTHTHSAQRSRTILDLVSIMETRTAMDIRVSSSSSSSSSSSPSSSSASSSSSISQTIPSQSSCTICLGSVSGEAFLDPCFHSFCFHCILQWSEMVSAHPSLEGDTYLECPLCKTRSSCIIYNVVHNTFQRFYLFEHHNSSAKHQFSLSRSHYQRLYVYYHKLHKAMADAICQSMEKREKMYDTFHSETEQTKKNKKKERILFPSLKNRNVILPWIQRELQSLLQEEDVNLITQHVIGVLEHFEGKNVLSAWKSSMAETVQPFISEYADAFCEEIESFLFSGLNMEGYDEIAKQVVETHTFESCR